MKKLISNKIALVLIAVSMFTLGACSNLPNEEDLSPDLPPVSFDQVDESPVDIETTGGNTGGPSGPK